jgi:lipopolysaccharide export system protein LptA
MRFVRPLFLLAILAILTGVGATYYARLKQQAGNAPERPKPLAPGTTLTSHAWDYRHTTGGNTNIALHAEDMQEINGKQELAGVTLDIYNKDGGEYDRVKSAKAQFDPESGFLYSDGDVEITMNVPVDHPPTGQLMVITTSGVHVEVKTSKAYTDRLATFKFDRGDGHAVGADYDPNTRELNLHDQVELNWRGTDPGTVPMKIETAQLAYKEQEAKVYLSPWSKLTRDTMTLNAGPAIVTLSDKNLKLVETTQAHGTDHRPDRNLEYSAVQLNIDFNDNNQVQRITAVDQARLVSTAETTATTLTADRVVMDFDATGSDSLLTTTLAQGHGVMENKPVVKPGVDPSDTRILKSEIIRTKMRPGGRDLESVETDTPGAIEFLPNRPEQPHRWMTGERISMAYAEKNQIQSVRSNAVTTRTEKPKLPADKETPAPELTWSKNLFATFQPNSTQIAKLEQWGDFRYEAGDRRAKADRAVLDQPNNVIDLTVGSRIWDSTGSANADRIVMNQKSGDFSAEGNVSSTRMPDKKKDDSDGGGMLSEDEPLHARAKKMVSTDNNLQIRYEGGAVLWQGANRLEADVVEIDRDNDNLKAHGHVMSQLLDKGKDDPKGKDDQKPAPNPPKKTETNPNGRVFTVVKAPELEYNDDDRIARYKNGVELSRTDMKVTAKEVVAYLRNNSDDSSLDHAIADGNVVIFEHSGGRVRNGNSEHAEYYVDDDKVILEGGSPHFNDNLRGDTQGVKLTWFSRDDRLLVDGLPAKSLLHKKKK